jgi:hypothetical protein
MTVAQQREQDQLERAALPDNGLLDLGEDRVGLLPEIGEPGQSDSTFSITATIC